MIPTEINYGSILLVSLTASVIYLAWYRFLAQGRASLKRHIVVFFLILLATRIIFWVVPLTSKWYIGKFIPNSVSHKASNASLLYAGSGAEFSGMPDAASGAVFSGETIRKFSGQWKFQSEALFGSHTVNDFPIMGKFCSHWGVVTTIHSPSLAVTKVAALSNWCTVIVADTKTPNDYLHLANLEDNPNVIFLTVEDQRKINNTFVSVTPFKSFARKNIGYLYAICHGAQIIYDFDDDNEIKEGKEASAFFDQELLTFLNTTEFTDADVALVTTTAFNPYPLMGSSNEDAWPRGFPLDDVKNRAAWGSVAYSNKTIRMNKVGVMQFCADKDPDVDAFQRLTKPLPMTFSGLASGSKGLVIPISVFVPYNAQATLHNTQAFWALLLPASVPGRVSDIWRGYFAEYFFHELGIHVMYLSPAHVIQERNEHDYNGDLLAELDLYLKCRRLLDFLKSWKGTAPHLPGRIEQLWVELFERGFIELEDVNLMQLWIGTLLKMEYNFPNLPPAPVRIRNVLLMGQFNYPSSLESILFWVQKWHTVFHNVIVCGPFDNNTKEELISNEISVITYDGDQGFYSPYENLKRVLEAQQKQPSKVDGVLYIHDDTLLNMTAILNISSSMIRDEVFPSKSILQTFPNDHFSSQIAIAFPNGSFASGNGFFLLHQDGFVTLPDHNIPSERIFFNNTDDILQALGVKPNPWHWWPYCIPQISAVASDPRSKRFHRDEHGGLDIPLPGQSDFMFVPMMLAQDFIDAADLASNYRVFLELAVPWISGTMCTAEKKELSLCTLWNDIRGSRDMIKSCRPDGEPKEVFHPFKISMGLAAWEDIFDEVTWNTGISSN